jgi:hypothetical protein
MSVINVPSELEHALMTRAARRKIGVNELVCEALAWYLQVGDDLLDELSAWQEIRDEAMQRCQEPPDR